MSDNTPSGIPVMSDKSNRLALMIQDQQKSETRRMGRPPLNRTRVPYGPALDAPTLAEVKHQAELAGVAVASYLEALTAAAHGYRGRYVLDLGSVPGTLDLEEVRSLTAGMAHDDCWQAEPGADRRTVRLDAELSDVVRRRAEELDVNYATYLTAVFRRAVGTSPGASHRQMTVFDIAAPRKEPPAAKAS